METEHKDDNTRVLYYDLLTDLPNMNYFLELAEEGCRDLIEREKLPAVLSFNLNGLKMFNQKYGIEEGRNLLISFGKLLEKYFSKKSASRFGEDHFYAYAESTGVEFKLFQIFDELKHLNNGRSLPVRVGIYTPSGFSDNVSAAVACDRARTACDKDRKTYESKYTYFTKQMEMAERERDYIVNNIDAAIAKGYIKAYYQPKVRTLDGKLSGAEVLARWDDPDYGFLSPGAFIPILEDSNLTYKLDIFILEQLAKDLKRCDDLGLTKVPVSFNLSRTDFTMTDPLQVLERVVENSGVDKSYFKVEITESTVMEDPVQMKTHIDNLRRAGFAVIMDDFGSAYSSLAMLREFSFDALKIDMGFMRSFDDRSREILKAIILMSKNLGMHTVAEGVDDQVQLDFLKNQGCEIIQGYYYGKPVPFDRFHDQLSQQGIKTESLEEREFFDIVGRENAITDQAYTLHFYDGNKITAFYENENYKKLTEVSSVLNGRGVDPEIGEKILEDYLRIVDRAIKGGYQEEMAYSVGDNYYRITVQKIASYSKGHMLRVYLHDVTFDRELVASLKGEDQTQGKMVNNVELDLWKLFMDKVNIKFFWKDLDRKFRGANQAFLDYYDMSLEELIGKTDEDMEWNGDEDDFMTDEFSVLKGEKVINSAGVTYVKGKKRNICANKYPIYQKGKIQGLMGYFMDVEQDLDPHRKDLRYLFTEDALDLSQRRDNSFPYEEMLQVYKEFPMAYAVYQAVMDPEKNKLIDFTYLYINERYSDALGGTQGQLIGKRLSQMVDREEFEFWLEKGEKAVLEGIESRGDRYSEKAEHWLEYTVAPTALEGCCINICEYCDREHREKISLKKDISTSDLVIRIANMLNMTADFDELMNQVLKELGRMVKTARLRLLIYENNKIGKAYEWCAEGVEPCEFNLYGKDYSKDRSWSEYLARETSVNIPSIEVMKENAPKFYELLKLNGIQRFLATPCYDGNRLVGHIVAENHQESHQVDTRRLLETVASFLANKIVSHQLSAELDYMSRHDGLT
nr:EAL domain-containing protein [Eubacterium sp.]